MTSDDQPYRGNPYRAGKSRLASVDEDSLPARSTFRRGALKAWSIIIDATGALMTWALGGELSYQLTRNHAGIVTVAASFLPPLAFLTLRYVVKTGPERKRLGWWISLGLTVFGSFFMFLLLLSIPFP